MSVASEQMRPPGPPPFLDWIRENLFSTWYNSLLTLVSLLIVYFAVTSAVRWVFVSADWAPVNENIMLYLVGQYPRGELWRIGALLLLVSTMFGISWGLWRGMMRSFSITLVVSFLILAALPSESAIYTIGVRIFYLVNPLLIFAGYWLGRRQFLGPRLVLLLWLATLAVTFVLLRGLDRNEFVPAIPVNLWGGLIVTTILAVGGITISFPIGILLALGRRSSLPVVKLFSTFFIEIIRGVPLITILFLGSLIVPLFLPQGIRIDRLVRALIGMIIFSAAYSAENIRGGLQAIPIGQIEAARAVGFNHLQTTVLIVLPQALRLVIPAIVGQFISLFKDTTLASGVAVLEILTIGRSILQANPAYLARQFEVYLFIAAIFWIFSYSMSVTSRRIETRLGVGER